jgi:hypothetical protein
MKGIIQSSQNENVTWLAWTFLLTRNSYKALNNNIIINALEIGKWLWGTDSTQAEVNFGLKLEYKIAFGLVIITV